MVDRGDEYVRVRHQRLHLHVKHISSLPGRVVTPTPLFRERHRLRHLRALSRQAVPSDARLHGSRPHTLAFWRGDGAVQCLYRGDDGAHQRLHPALDPRGIRQLHVRLPS